MFGHSKIMANLIIVMDVQQKEEHVRRLLMLDGLTHVTEERDSAYCPISLTSVPPELKPAIASRQKWLMDLLKGMGIRAYDPLSSTKYSPDLNLNATHRDVYFFDAARVAAGEYFTGHKILPSDGQGVESEIAKSLGKKSVILLDREIRVSRMMPSRTIYLSYDKCENHSDEVRALFQMLQEYDTGFGLKDNLPVLVGFPRNGGSPVDLEEAVYHNFPGLQFHYDGTLPIVRLKAENPELFYELRK